ncbi:MAG: hypothetical protein C0469_10205 [Cyanobacteria bacterium DS2.3.42]|nr:hypothetical protein [Cyanobacteria bacterium DS2.3.42]
MVNDTTAVTSPADAACEDARKDGDAIRNAFATKGIEEAYALLKEERKNAGTLSPIEKDIWEKELVNALSANGGKTDVLPGLSLAYLKENKSTFTNPDDGDEYDVRSVNGEARRMFDKREMEDDYTGGNKDLFKNKVDDIDVVLVGNAAHVLNTNDYGGEKVKEIEDLDEVLEDNKKNAATEAGYQTTRDFNKSIAETFVKNKTLFSAVDEIDGEKGDGELTDDEVDDFLKRVKNSEGFKARFSEEEIKAVEALKTTFDDDNNEDDKNSNLVKTERNFWSANDHFITQESILQSVGGEEGVKAIEAKVAEAKAKLDQEMKQEKTEDETKTEEEKVEEEKVDDEKVDDEKVENKDEKVEEEKKPEEEKTEVVDTETQMLNDAVQKAGEGPYQVAARLLRGKQDMAAQIALTKILKEQLTEDTESKTYMEAVSKMQVGHVFFTCEGLEKIREKVAASGNKTLMEMFGAPTVKEETPKEV